MLPAVLCYVCKNCASQRSRQRPLPLITQSAAGVVYCKSRHCQGRHHTPPPALAQPMLARSLSCTWRLARRAARHSSAAAQQPLPRRPRSCQAPAAPSNTAAATVVERNTQQQQQSPIQKQQQRQQHQPEMYFLVKNTEALPCPTASGQWLEAAPRGALLCTLPCKSSFFLQAQMQLLVQLLLKRVSPKLQPALLPPVDQNPSPQHPTKQAPTPPPAPAATACLSSPSTWTAWLPAPA